MGMALDAGEWSAIIKALTGWEFDEEELLRRYCDAVGRKEETPSDLFPKVATSERSSRRRSAVGWIRTLGELRFLP